MNYLQKAFAVAGVLMLLAWLPLAGGTEPGKEAGREAGPETATPAGDSRGSDHRTDQSTDLSTDSLVWLVELDGPLGPATADLIIRSLADASAANAAALIIRMDTPGGLDKSMRLLVQAILAAEIPVITYVSPGGARAASAGTYIAYASHIAAMAPATNIGSSTPVSIGGPTPTLPAAGDDTDKPPPVADAMTKKVVNDAVAYLQGLAELRGRNIVWAEATVREGVNIRSSEALALNVIDLVSDDLDTLLDSIDGWEVELKSGTVTLATAAAAVHRVETDWIHEVLELITDPTIAYALLIFGVYGLILEFYNPGMIFPAVVGVVCLLLGAYGLHLLPVNYAGMALIIVGIGMMVGEAFTPTMGALGIAGVVAFAFGSMMLLDTESAEFGLPLAVIAAFTVSTAAITLMAVGAAVKARSAAVRTGTESMIGAAVEVLEGFEEYGRVSAFGEIWQARALAPVATGRHAEITAVDGLTLVIRPTAT